MTTVTEVLPLTIVYEDASIIAIDKPAGLLVIPDRWDKMRPNLYHMLGGSGNIFVVHRLDKDASGLVLFAKTAQAHRTLCRQFERRHVEKVYAAVVEGKVLKSSGRITFPISEDPKRKGTMKATLYGKAALTEYRVVERFHGFTYLRVYPHGGRTHQIRVHLAAIGHPLAVDPLYGRRMALYPSDIRSGERTQDEAPIISRLTLHAMELVFRHPLTGQRMRLKASLPEDLVALLDMLRRQAGVRS